MMDSGMIGKIEKGKRYAEERGKRIHFQSFTVQVDGDNSSHTVKLENGQVQCDCDFFRTRGRCSHTIALETVLEGMLPVREVA
ncbi:MAG: SWIM zinc finger family protein [Anaerolineaceae bacterium]|jgi:hypothetical protein